MAFQFDLPTLVNILAFIGLTIATYTIFIFGRSLDQGKGIRINLFTLALGINLIGLSHLFRVFLDSTTSPIILSTIGLGALFMSTGVIWVFYERSREVSRLQKREFEIKSIIARLKDKYYQQELSEEDLKTAYSGLLRELAEIEVRLNSKESK